MGGHDGSRDSLLTLRCFASRSNDDCDPLVPRLKVPQACLAVFLSPQESEAVHECTQSGARISVPLKFLELLIHASCILGSNVREMLGGSGV